MVKTQYDEIKRHGKGKRTKKLTAKEVESVIRQKVSSIRRQLHN